VKPSSSICVHSPSNSRNIVDIEEASHLAMEKLDHGGAGIGEFEFELMSCRVRSQPPGYAHDAVNDLIAQTRGVGVIANWQILQFHHLLLVRLAADGCESRPRLAAVRTEGARRETT
jgi:hypothetical protein